MADSDEIFLAVAEPVGAVGEWVSHVLGLELLAGTEDELQYRGRGRSFDGWVGVFVERNSFEPEPGEVQAMDRYGVRVDVQSRTHKGKQAEEARLMFEALVAGMPEVPVLLSHNLEVLVAASRPGVGTHYFEANTWLDGPDVEPWKPWVLLSE
ncbi:hypothetical protein Kfla_4604 [Kribbella flavida DSM 17836]|uniref:Uncharacterized protein n=1 Tax=Kribbella flavida (strain DSM 17836 / JCM 10339 / NBRC 14399) TaxID=479435 RepID=D2PY16_KRIFD|nr:hypothetical protein [Kribbella flavida]ADB33622.1 hypothetical protein Kfla_4604 [Kribbella flavida DSM 17836]